MRTIIALALASTAGIAFAKADDSGSAAAAPTTAGAAPAEGQAVNNEGDGDADNGTGESAPTSDKLVPLMDKDKVKAVKAALGGDRVFYDSEEGEGNSAFDKASKAIEEASGKTDSFYGLPLLTREGSESAHITDAKRICVATVGVRDKATSTNGLKAIVAFEAPAIDDFKTDESEAAVNWVAKLIEREATDVAFQGLRAAESLSDLETAVVGIPATVGDIVTTSRESSGLDTDAFDAVWMPFRIGVLRKKMPKVEAALPTKPDIIKSIRSASYAKANPKCTVLEEAGLFVKIAKAMIQAGPQMKDADGKPTPVDMSTVQDWIDNRESLNLGYSEPTVNASDLVGIEF